ncbi:hypothetical protein PQ455_15285 [Sphingomonas naphthae]|uniref:Uncharacterized protein n=1 Tax=Sphingomonas naphthae TaxID=1813468 RepID=A0ABY7TJ96_9SPHN|nr:hypothetical protein [Sphingomonas naphthae]WCT72983.1 hypothetical protein PQ455_15285 [Sphingomonas naphthae]
MQATDPREWPRLAERDVAAIRLSICRELLGVLAEQGGSAGAADFGEVDAFLSGWTGEDVRADPAAFCREAIRLLSLMLAHVDAAGFEAMRGVRIGLE